jgi:MFS family permease
MSSVASVRRLLTFGDLPADFRRLWVASASSNLADGIVRVAIAVIAVRLTSEPLLVAGVSIAGALPSVLVVLLAGVSADRFDRRRILFVAEGTRIATLVVVAVLAAVDGLSLPLLLVAAFVLGIQQTFYDATAATLVPLIVEARDITRGNSRFFAAEIVADVFVGPPLGGLLVAAGAVLAFGGSIIGYVIAIGGLVLMTGRYRVSRDGPRRSIVHDIAEGLRYLAFHPLQRVLTTMVAISNFAAMAFISVFALFALAPGPMGLSEAGYGVFLALFGIGSLLGTAIAPRVERRLGTARTLLTSAFIGALTYFVPALTPALVPVGLSIILAGTTALTWGVVNVSLRQRFVPREIYGRVQSGHRLAANLAGLLGGAVAGVAATIAGLQAAFVVAGVASLVSCLGWFWVNDRTVAAALAASPDPDVSKAAAELLGMDDGREALS